MTNLHMVLCWGLFYLLHTVLAASKLKRILESKWPISYKWYRLFYSIIASILFLGILVLAIFLPVEFVFSPGSFSQYAGYMVSTGGVIVLVRSFKQIPLRAFFGFQTEKVGNEIPELVITGIYSQIRHPLYFGLLTVFLGYFLVSGTIGALIHLGCLILYLPFGIYFEEKNLVAVFGEKYRVYQNQVPSFFPKIHKKRG